jgi:hypothetical protein
VSVIPGLRCASPWSSRMGTFGLSRLPPKPSQNRTSGFPTSGSSVTFRVDAAPERIQVLLPSHRGPTHPGESRVKLLPSEALPLTASIQPFEEYPLNLVLEGFAPR